MNYKFLIKLPLYLGVTIALISCDDDLSTVGGQVIDTIPGNGFTKEDIAVAAYSERIQKVQINGLPGVLLGTNQDQFGSRTHSVLTQVGLSSYEQSAVNETAVLDSVVVSIPYFSTVTSATTNEDQQTITEYELDSIRNAEQKINLSLIPSNYFLSNFDADNLENNKIYFNDEFNNEQGVTTIPSLGDPLFTKEIPISAKENTFTVPECGETEKAFTKRRPGIELSLEEPNILTFFDTQILKKLGSTELSNQNNFQSFFRGFYIKVDANKTNALAYLPLNLATITLHYSETDDSQTPECATKINKTVVLNFQGNTLNLVEGTFDPGIAGEIEAQNQDKESGADKIYLKGGDGSIGVIKLFSETPQLLDELADDNVIINDALLRFYLDDQIQLEQLSEEERKAIESQRIFIYNYETGEPLIDFLTNPQLGSVDPGTSFSNHLGLLQEEDGSYYFDIKITQHVKNLIYNNDDGENPLLGLCVTANTELPLVQTQTGIIINQNAIKAVDNGGDGTTKIPEGAIIDPDGLVLVGNKTTDPKKLKLILTYTQPIN